MQKEVQLPVTKGTRKNKNLVRKFFFQNSIFIETQLKKKYFKISEFMFLSHLTRTEFTHKLKVCGFR